MDTASSDSIQGDAPRRCSRILLSLSPPLHGIIVKSVIIDLGQIVIIHCPVVDTIPVESRLRRKLASQWLRPISAHHSNFDALIRISCDPATIADWAFAQILPQPDRVTSFWRTILRPIWLALLPCA